jgi:ribonucleotide monophosphatase NagD (HAD superfamily)
MPTDIKGAADFGLDVLYVSAGIHAAEYGDADNPDAERLQAFLDARGASPVAWIPRLCW